MKTATPDKIAVEIPRRWVVEASDYHEFGEMKRHYRKISVNADFVEVGMSGFLYVAVFWVGEMPAEFVQEMRLKH